MGRLMRKKELMEAMRDLDDDAEIHVFCTSLDWDGGEYAQDVYIDDVVKGDDVVNEMTLVAYI